MAFLPMLVTTRALRRDGQVNRLVRWVAPRPANDAVQAAAPLREGSIPTSFCVASQAILDSFFEKGICIAQFCIARELPMRPSFRDLGQRSVGAGMGRLPSLPAGSVAGGDLPRASAISTRQK